MDIRIGVTQAPRELTLEMDDDTDRDALRALIDGTLADDDKVLWLTDKRGRAVGIPAKKVAYIELGPVDGERRIGFGA
ncbi:MAG TPA: DUF3107 domain-containing protein [Acidimicrobiales bacterium]